MGLRDELLAEVGPKTHIAELCGRAADELLIKQMKIDQQAREIDRLRYVLSGVRSAINTGRREPLMVWREQINIAIRERSDDE